MTVRPLGVGVDGKLPKLYFMNGVVSCDATGLNRPSFVTNTIAHF